MYTQAIYYAIPLLFGATVALAFCFLALQRYREAGALSFVAAMASVALWSFAYAFELMSPTLADKMLWHRIIYTTSAAVPAFWMLFLLQHEQASLSRLRLWTGLLMLEPLLYTFLTWTNGHLHHWLWREITLTTDTGLSVMEIERGLGFYIHVGLTAILTFLSVIFFLRIVRRESSTLAPHQIVLMVLGVIAPVIANGIHVLGLNPLAINLTPFALITMGASVGWFAFRFELWDILPAAHDAVFAGMGDGVIVLTLNHVIIDSNPAAHQLLGVSERVLTGHRLSEVLRRHPHLSQLQSLVDQVTKDKSHMATFDGKNVPAVEIDVAQPKRRHLDILVSPLRDRRRRINGWILTLRDVTIRHEMEVALQHERAQLAHRVEERTQELSQANAELARAGRLKDEFLANMSHELRTPLNTVLGLAEALQDDVYGVLNEKQERALQHVLDSGRHLLALINDILDVSKIEAGKLKLEAGPVPVDALCTSSINLVKQSAAKKRLEIVVDIDPAVKVVFGDERRLKQILVNLLGNAVKFTPDGGKIGIQVVGEPENDLVRLIVWDTGIGIAEENLSELFEPFVQLDSRIARAHEGTGLGLALVHRMVDLHGGSIAVESTPKVGSKFIVALPWYLRTVYDMTRFANRLYAYPSLGPVEETVPRLPTPTATYEGWPSLVPTILLVEDNETNISTFSDYLEAKGYRLIVARSGAEALLRLLDVTPHIILLDIQMPEMDGLEVAQLIRKGEHACDVPIIALTALAMPGDRERCLAVGMNEYLSKPVSLRKLTEVVEQYVPARELPALPLVYQGEAVATSL